MMYLALAWRNLWRNRRRTLITMASVASGVLFTIAMTSIQEGSYQQYIDIVVHSWSGHIQIHSLGYTDDPQINNLMENVDSISSVLEINKDIFNMAMRIESYALASAGRTTKGVVVAGIQPNMEDRITAVSQKMVAGIYLSDTSKGVIIGSRLSQYLNLKTGDTLVLISQGYHGVSAAGLFPVEGIIKHPSVELDKQIVFMNLSTCQQFFSVDRMASSIVLLVRDNKMMKPLQIRLKEMLGENFEVKNLEEMNAILLKQIESDRVQGYFTKGILYMVIGFGILGTLMMMLQERRREFGVLIAIGMQKYRLSLMMMAEAFMLTLSGVIAGIAISLPVIYYFYFHPIPLTGQAADLMAEMGFDPVISFSVHYDVFLSQAIVLLAMTLFISFYSVNRISKLKVISALKT